MTAKPQDSTNELGFPTNGFYPNERAHPNEWVFPNERVFPYQLAFRCEWVFPFVGAGLAPPGVNAATLSPVKLSCLTLSREFLTPHNPTRIAKFPEEPR
jgi:hypothetical protein